MGSAQELDAVVVGSGPNGLAAAITLAKNGRSVLVIEARSEIGGGCRSANLTLPGFVHDVCSGVHPMAVSSPIFRSLPLEEHGLNWVHPEIPLAHPMDDGTAVILDRSLELTASQLDSDGQAWRRLIGPFVDSWDSLAAGILGPLFPPRNLVSLTRFGLKGFRPSTFLAKSKFDGDRARALFAGLAAHAIMPLTAIPTGPLAITLAASAHAVGWPMASGGSQSISNALALIFCSLGGQIETDREIKSIDELNHARTIVFDVTPRQLLRIVGPSSLPPRYRRRLSRFRYGPGVFKVDFALDAPIPWKAEECLGAGTLHIGGTLEEIASSERDAASGTHSDRPFVILAQQSLFDESRAPKGKHTAWAYCHVPSGSRLDATELIENQIERFAPGFRDQILAKHSMGPSDFESYNPNYIGGSIDGGSMRGLQLFARPLVRFDPYSTPNPKVFMCSASTPPGAGVHGMCGFFAARSVQKRTPARTLTRMLHG